MLHAMEVWDKVLTIKDISCVRNAQGLSYYFTHNNSNWVIILLNNNPIGCVVSIIEGLHACPIRSICLSVLSSVRLFTCPSPPLWGWRRKGVYHNS